MNLDLATNSSETFGMVALVILACLLVVGIILFIKFLIMMQDISTIRTILEKWDDEKQSKADASEHARTEKLS